MTPFTVNRVVSWLIVDERPEPERIEIELTSHDAADRQPAATPPTTSPEPSKRTGWLESERGRLLAATAFVGVLALFVGVLVGGRAGSNQPAALDDAGPADDTETTTSSAEDDVETPTTLGTLDNADTLPAPADITTTTERATSTPDSGSREVLPTAPGESSVIRIAPEVSDLPVELIVRRRSGELVTVDLATGSAVRLDAPRGSLGGIDSIMHAGDDWILFTNLGGGSSSVLLADGTIERTSLGDGPMFVAEDAERIWAIDYGFAATDWSMREHRIDGTPTGREIGTGDIAPSVVQGLWPRAVDPLGGVFVNAPGGTYAVGADAIEKVSSGWLVAGGASRVFALECDEVLVCRHVVIDRATGERRTIELDRELAESPQLEAGLWGTGDFALDPAEQRVLLTVWNRTPDGLSHFGVLDLETGAYAQIGPDQPQSIRWTPDGRFVVWLSGSGDLYVFDPDSEESVRLSDDLAEVQAFAMRSAIPDSDG